MQIVRNRSFVLLSLKLFLIPFTLATCIKWVPKCQHRFSKIWVENLKQFNNSSRLSVKFLLSMADILALTGKFFFGFENDGLTFWPLPSSSSVHRDRCWTGKPHRYKTILASNSNYFILPWFVRLFSSWIIKQIMQSDLEDK